MKPRQLKAHHEVSDKAVIVRFQGEVDMSVADEFDSHLKTALDAASTHPARLLLIDLKAIDFFASCGLSGAVGCHEEGVAKGVAVWLVGASRVVVRVIQATRLDQVLTLYPTLDDALSQAAVVVNLPVGKRARC